MTLTSQRVLVITVLGVATEQRELKFEILYSLQKICGGEMRQGEKEYHTRTEQDSQGRNLRLKKWVIELRSSCVVRSISMTDAVGRSEPKLGSLGGHEVHKTVKFETAKNAKDAKIRGSVHPGGPSAGIGRNARAARFILRSWRLGGSIRPTIGPFTWRMRSLAPSPIVVTGLLDEQFPPSFSEL
jgi:hypothetical protein